VVLFLTVFIDLVGFGMVIPQLPAYGRLFHATATEIGLLGGVYSFMQFLMAPIWGSLSDRHGRRPILLSSLFGIACAYVMFAQGDPTADGLRGSFWWLFAARALAGLCAANISTAVAYVADVTTPQDRAKGMGIIGAAFGMGFVFGPALGGIAGQHALMLPPQIAACLSMVAFVLALFALPESREKGAKPRELGFRPLMEAFKNPVLSRWMYSYLFYMVAVASMEVALPLFLGGDPFHYDQRPVGYLFTYLGLVVAAIQGGGIRRMVKKTGEGPVARRGVVMSVVGLLLLPFAGSLTWLVVALTFLACGQGFAQPTLMALISRSASSEEQGTVMGVSQSLASFGRIIGPPLAGFLYGVYRGLPFWAAAVFCCVTAGLMAAAQLPPSPPTVPNSEVSEPSATVLT
jgi:MFS family permease